MGAINSTVQINDGMSPALKNINKALNTVISSFEAMQAATESPVDVESINAAREALAQTEVQVDDVSAGFRRSQEEIERFGDNIRQSGQQVDSLDNKLKKVLSTVASIAAVKKVIGFVDGSKDLYNVQTNAENQLRSVLASTGAGQTDFDKLLEKSSQVQSRGIYGDEAMIAGAGELATYISDSDAISSMMDTLANYAMGMSGGGEISSTQMVDYATQLGKALNGTYDGLKKKGFELTDTQKKVIETGTDMEKALVLDEIISESWSNLYETMSDTPEGKVIQLQNAFGDLREELGGKLYSTSSRIVEDIANHWDTVDKAMDGVTNAIHVGITVFGAIASAGMKAADFIADNWQWIAPIVYGVAAALAAYGAYLAINNGIEAVSAAGKTVLTVAEYAHAAATGKAVATTTAETAAQMGLNTALLACPLTWILVSIIAIIAILYAVVGAINKVTGSSVSATGIIMGVLATAGAFVYDLFLGLVDVLLAVVGFFYNGFSTAANFVGNVFVDPVGAVIHLFGDMADTVLSILQSIAGAMDKVFGSDLASSVEGWRGSLSAKVEETASKYGNGKYQKVLDTVSFSTEDLGLDRIALGDAYNSGYDFGSNIADSVKSALSAGDKYQYDDILSGLGNIADSSDATAGSTGKMADDLSVGTEELKYLRDLAEQETINRFTTAEIKVEMTNHNSVSSNMDLDSMVDYLASGVESSMEQAAEGVHE